MSWSADEFQEVPARLCWADLQGGGEDLGPHGLGGELRSAYPAPGTGAGIFRRGNPLALRLACQMARSEVKSAPVGLAAREEMAPAQTAREIPPAPSRMSRFERL